MHCTDCDHPYYDQPYYVRDAHRCSACDNAAVGTVRTRSAVTLLDPLETSGHGNNASAPTHEFRPRVQVLMDPEAARRQYDRTLPEPLEPGTCFRHEGWKALRKRVYRAIVESGATRSRRENFANCGAQCFVLQSTTNATEYKLAARCCHDRFCVPCANERSRVIANNVLTYLEKSNCRFVTLTLRADGKSLAERVDRLYEAFKRLRKTDLWKKTQTGGVAFLEVKRTDRTANWHPHLHVLTQGKFIPLDRLRHAWLQITGDSSIVDVRAVTQTDHAVNYVTKYASKPLDRTIFENDATLTEAVHALSGRRMMLTFGNWRGLKLTAKPQTDQWVTLGSLHWLCHEAARGAPDADRILRLLCGDRADMLITNALHSQPPPPQQPLTTNEFQQLTLLG